MYHECNKDIYSHNIQIIKSMIDRLDELNSMINNNNSRLLEIP